MLPERINVMRVITYDVQNIVESLTENDEEWREVTLDEVLDIVQVWANDDFALEDIPFIYVDENGEEL